MLKKVLIVCVALTLATVLVGVAGSVSTQTLSNPSTASAATVKSTTTTTTAHPIFLSYEQPTTLQLQSYTGPFVGSVNSNVYHYPWCFEAKKILAKNLVIFPTVADACAAGYRPCEECKPPACLPTPTPTPTPTPSQTYEVQISGDVSSNHTGYFFATVTNQAGVSQTLNWQINWFLNGQLAGGTWTPSGGITVPLTPGVQYTVTATYLTPAQWPNVGSTLATSAPFYVTG
jgi:hypothetical protein